MASIPIEYPTRLRSPDEARELYASLGDAHVGVRGFRTSDPSRIDRLVAAVDPERDSSIHLEDGTLGETSWTELDELAATRPQYLDLHAGAANLRAWPEQTKVYARLPDGGVPDVALALGRPLRAGLNQFDDATVMIDPVAGYPLAVALTTTERALALALYRALGGPQLPRGNVVRANEATKVVLAPFVRGLGATVHVAMELGVDRARELSATCRDLRHDWEANAVHVDFPEGRIHGFLKTPESRDREQWLARVAGALRR